MSKQMKLMVDGKEIDFSTIDIQYGHMSIKIEEDRVYVSMWKDPFYGVKPVTLYELIVNGPAKNVSDVKQREQK